MEENWAPVSISDGIFSCYIFPFSSFSDPAVHFQAEYCVFYFKLTEVQSSFAKKILISLCCVSNIPIF